MRLTKARRLKFRFDLRLDLVELDAAYGMNAESFQVGWRKDPRRAQSSWQAPHQVGDKCVIEWPGESLTLLATMFEAKKKSSARKSGQTFQTKSTKVLVSAKVGSDVSRVGVVELDVAQYVRCDIDAVASGVPASGHCDVILTLKKCAAKLSRVAVRLSWQALTDLPPAELSPSVASFAPGHDDSGRISARASEASFESRAMFNPLARKQQPSGAPGMAFDASQDKSAKSSSPQLRAEIDVLQEQLASKSGDLERAEMEILRLQKQLNEERANEESEANALRKQLEKAKAKLERERRAAEELREEKANVERCLKVSSAQVDSLHTDITVSAELASSLEAKLKRIEKARDDDAMILADAEARVAKAEARVASLQAEIAESKETMTSLETQAVQSGCSLQEMQQLLQERDDRVSELEQELHQTQQRQRAAEQLIRDARDEIANFRSSTASSDSRDDELRLALADKLQLETEKQQLESAKQRLESQNQQLANDKKKLETESSKLKTQKRNLVSDKQQLENEKQQLESRNQQLENEKQQLETEKRQLETEKRQLEAEKQELETENEELEAENEELEAANSNVARQLETKQAENAQLTQRLERLEQDRQTQGQSREPEQSQEQSQEQSPQESDRGGEELLQVCQELDAERKRSSVLQSELDELQRRLESATHEVAKAEASHKKLQQCAERSLRRQQKLLALVQTRVQKSDRLVRSIDSQVGTLESRMSSLQQKAATHAWQQRCRRGDLRARVAAAESEQSTSKARLVELEARLVEQERALVRAKVQLVDMVDQNSSLELTVMQLQNELEGR
ncbi:MAG: hypothetical protein MHM6MM_000517 [Cercozoa sp. M6MM]